LVIKLLKQISSTQLNQLAEVFTKAFFNYPLYTYLFPNEATRYKKMMKYYKPFIRYGVLCGGLYVTSDKFEGIIVILSDKDAQFPLKKAFRSGVLRYHFTVGLSYLKRASKLRNHYPSTMDGFPKDKTRDPVYLMMLAVDPSHQKQGFARALLEDRLAQIDPTTHPCYIETYLPRNVEIYKKSGFKLIKQDTIQGLDIPVWSLRRAS
jgi:ribosomal protein S18 acetylase RimI-like enzyme